VELLFFAAAADAVGVARERATLPASVATLADLREHLANTYPNLARGLASVRFARNEVFATDDEILCDGDVIALIPPVAGG